jgi:hypothetical protein
MRNNKFVFPYIAYCTWILISVTGCRKPDVVDAVPPIPGPGQLAVAEVRSNGFIVKWPGSSEASSYDVFVSTDTNFTQLVPGYNPKRTTSTSDTCYSLTRATRYYIKVQSVQNSAVGNVSVISATTTTEDVYVAGFQTVGGGGSFTRAKYWLNGVAKELESDSLTYESQAHDIFVSGNDVYVAGMDRRWGYPENAVYWKNGKRVNLTTGYNKAGGNAIFVLGDDIYVAGYSNHVWISTATLWKNGKVVFADSYSNSAAKSMFVSDSDVHLVGYGYNDTGTVVARYWKNGQPTMLSNRPMGGQGTSVFVSGSDVYVAGFDITSTVPGLASTATAKYWKNGSEVLYVDPQRYSRAEGIYVDGNDIYIAGSLDEKPAYWKNGLATILPGGKNCVTTGIDVLGKDVYVCGYELVQFATFGMYWKNGVPVELTSRYEGSAFMTSIFVK